MSSFGPQDGITQTATILKGPSRGQITAITSGTMLHPEWTISWRDTDLPTLTPRPPSLSLDATLLADLAQAEGEEVLRTRPTTYSSPTSLSTRTTSTTLTRSSPSFTPGATQSTQEPTETHGFLGNKGPAIYFAAVGLPLLIFACLFSTCFYCCWKSKSQRHRREMESRRRADVEVSERRASVATAAPVYTRASDRAADVDVDTGDRPPLYDDLPPVYKPGP